MLYVTAHMKVYMLSGIIADSEESLSPVRSLLPNTQKHLNLVDVSTRSSWRYIA